MLLLYGCLCTHREREPASRELCWARVVVPHVTTPVDVLRVPKAAWPDSLLVGHSQRCSSVLAGDRKGLSLRSLELAVAERSLLAFLHMTQNWHKFLQQRGTRSGERGCPACVVEAASDMEIRCKPLAISSQIYYSWALWVGILIKEEAKTFGIPTPLVQHLGGGCRL